MAVLATLVQVGAVLALTWWVLGRYRDALVPPAVLAAVFCSWALGFLGLLLLPMDITSNGLELTAQSLSAYLDAWELLYWLTFLLSWLVLPFLAELRLNGEFSLKTRVTSSLRNLVFHWSILSAAALVVALYLLFVSRLSLHGVVGLAMASANTYGLLWLVALLGYGLVDIPRSFWTLRTPERQLRQRYFSAVQLHEERMEAIFLYDEVRIDVSSCFQRMLQAESDAIVLTSNMQHVKTCLARVTALIDGQKQSSSASDRSDAAPKAFAGRTRASTVGSASFTAKAKRAFSVGARTQAAPTLQEVVALHRRVRVSQLELRRCEQTWIDLCVRVEKLQDQVAERELPASCLLPDTSLINRARNLALSARFRLHSVVSEPVSIACAVAAGAASLCILWSELTMGWHMPSLSLFRWVIYHEKTVSNEPNRSATPAEFVALALLVYMVVCAYSSVFKLRWFGKYALVAHGNSTELCLLKSSTLPCRLQFALGYNVLLLLNDREVTDRTAFHALFDKMHVVHVFGQSFSVYASVLMVLLVGLTLSNAYAKAIATLGLEQYEQLSFGDDPAGQTQTVARGEQLVQKALERHHALIARRKRAYDSGGASVYGFAPTTTVAQSLLDDDDDGDVGGGDMNKGPVRSARTRDATGWRSSDALA